MNSDQPQAHAFVLPPLPELRRMSVFGRKICYYDRGAGPVVVLVHGIGGDADEWAFCLDELSSSNRVIALDLLGFGRSDKPRIDYSIEVFVEVLEAFLQTMAIERASLVGSSLGGWIVAVFALKFPERTDRLVLVDAAGLRVDAAELAIDLRISTRQHMREVFNSMFYDKSLVTEELVDFAYHQHLERDDGYTIQSVLRSFHEHAERLDEKITKVNVPTLIVWGQQDAVIPPSVGQKLQRLIKGSRLEIIPECGHLPALEKPAEFVRHLNNFLPQSKSGQ